MLTKRILAEIIDITSYLLSSTLSLILTVPILKDFNNQFRFIGIFIVIVLFFGSPLLIQYLFWIQGRSIGKMYTGLVVIREDNKEPADFNIMLVREVFSKCFSLWIVTIPVFAGKKGIHEKATQTEIRIYEKNDKKLSN